MTTKEKGKEQTIPDILKTIASSYLTNNCKNCPFLIITETCDSVPLNCSWLGLYRHYKEIDNSQTVDAVQYTLGYQDGFLEGKKICERPHGEWLFNTTFWNCSVCKKPAKTIGYCGDEKYMNVFFKFCPNCGSDMRPENKVRIPSCLTNPERQAELLERYKEE